MRVVAKELGFWDTLREPGQEFDVDDNATLPDWVEKVGGKKKKAAPAGDDTSDIA
jgi:hypothetical protein